jgi:hypothetical protein
MTAPSEPLSPACAAFHEVAPELALGVAEGDQRAAALDHLVGCQACRGELDRLTATVDAVVQIAPEAEPPTGFETRALAAFAPVEHRPVARRRVLLAAAAVLAIVAAGIGVRALVDGDGPATPSEQVAAAQESAPLANPHDVEVGTVRVERRAGPDGASASDLVVSVDAGGPVGTFRVECDYESGRSYRAGSVEIGADGLDDWRTTVAVPTYDLTRVRLVSTSGNDNLEAEFEA